MDEKKNTVKTERLYVPGADPEILPDNPETEDTDPKTERLPVPGNPETTVDTHFTGSLKEGEIINGYTIGKLLSAHTGEAEIFFAEKDAKKAVVKYYHGTIKPVEEILQKLKDIKHPDIIQLYDFGTYNGRYFEIMEFAAGGTLGDKNPDGTYRYLPLSEQQVIQILQETCESLAFIHQRGIIHRDIKPGNLFYRNSNGSDVMIGDFGISSLLDMEQGQNNRVTTKIALSEGYAAPELYGIARDEGEAKILIGPEVDYYALGMTVFELLTGISPFRGKNPMNIMRDTIEGRVINDLLSMPVAQNFSPRIKTLLQGLLTVKHDKRWGYDELRQWLIGGDVEVYKEESLLNSRNFSSDDPVKAVQESSIPTLKFGDLSINSINQLIRAIDMDKELGLKYLKRGFLDKWASTFDASLANAIIDAKEVDLPGTHPVSYLLFRIDSSRKCQPGNHLIISNLDELRNAIRNHPKTIKDGLAGLVDSDLIPWLYLYYPDSFPSFVEASATIQRLPETKKGKAYKIINDLYFTISADSIQPLPNHPVEIKTPEELLSFSDDKKPELLEELKNKNSILYLWLSRNKKLQFEELWNIKESSWAQLKAILKNDLGTWRGKTVTMESRESLIKEEADTMRDRNKFLIRENIDQLNYIKILVLFLSFAMTTIDILMLYASSESKFFLIRDISFFILTSIFYTMEASRFSDFFAKGEVKRRSGTEIFVRHISFYPWIWIILDGLFRSHGYLGIVIPGILISAYRKITRRIINENINIYNFYNNFKTDSNPSIVQNRNFLLYLLEKLSADTLSKFEWKPEKQILLTEDHQPSDERSSLFIILDKKQRTGDLAFTGKELLKLRNKVAVGYLPFENIQTVKYDGPGSNEMNQSKILINNERTRIGAPFSGAVFEVLSTITEYQKLLKAKQKENDTKS